MAGLRTLALIALYICLSPLIVAVMLLAMLAVTLRSIYSWCALRWQSRRHGVRYYLVCSSRRGWHEFLANNLLAVLPANVAPVWSSGECDVLSRLPLHALISHGAGVAKPYLAEVRPLGIRVRSLHDLLLPLKGSSQKDAELQKLLRELIEQELAVSA